jgi:tetratricopeptide (TPR) repeat protein
VRTRQELAEALVHTFGGLDEAGLATLTEAERIAIEHSDLEAVARVRAELGYVDFLRGRYDRAERLLDQVLESEAATRSDRAKAMTYLGSVASDQADYPRALALLEGAVTASRAVGAPRREAYGLSMLGRVGLLRGDLDAAADHLRAAVQVAEAEHWLSFLPWPQALLGHVLLARGDLDGAGGTLEQSFARACQIGDPCWEGIAARGLALLAEAGGDEDRALTDLQDARSRAVRLADPYAWLDVHILDALCELGCRHGHPMTAAWVDQMHERASRFGMQELTVRAMVHGARLGVPGEAEAALLLGGTIDNPRLAALLAELG